MRGVFFLQEYDKFGRGSITLDQMREIFRIYKVKTDSLVATMMMVRFIHKGYDCHQKKERWLGQKRNMLKKLFPIRPNFWRSTMCAGVSAHSVIMSIFKSCSAKCKRMRILKCSAKCKQLSFSFHWSFTLSHWDFQSALV